MTGKEIGNGDNVVTLQNVDPVKKKMIVVKNEILVKLHIFLLTYGLLELKKEGT